jgi:hypothetical protein
MIYWLAQAAKKKRESGKRKLIHIAVEADMDPSTIYRFEQGHWPRDPDHIIGAYAADLEIDPSEFWDEAAKLYAANQNGDGT